MNKVEIKRIGIKSAVKVVMYFMALPAILCVAIGAVMALIGSATGDKETQFVGIVFALAYPIMLVVMYGLGSMLTGAIYNFLAGKFGGLELQLDIKDSVIEVAEDHKV